MWATRSASSGVGETLLNRGNLHPDRPSGAAQPYGDGKDLDFVVGRALQWCISDVEECAKPRRPEANVDLVDAHVDAIDQGGEHCTPACDGQLGPALSKFHGPRDKPLLSRRI